MRQLSESINQLVDVLQEIEDTVSDIESKVTREAAMKMLIDDRENFVKDLINFAGTDYVLDLIDDMSVDLSKHGVFQ